MPPLRRQDVESCCPAVRSSHPNTPPLNHRTARSICLLPLEKPRRSFEDWRVRARAVGACLSGPAFLRTLGTRHPATTAGRICPKMSSRSASIVSWISHRKSTSFGTRSQSATTFGGDRGRPRSEVPTTAGRSARRTRRTLTALVRVKGRTCAWNLVSVKSLPRTATTWSGELWGVSYGLSTMITPVAIAPVFNCESVSPRPVSSLAWSLFVAD